MSSNTLALCIAALLFAWAALALGTCAYAVFWLNRSGWWFLLAITVAVIPICSVFVHVSEEIYS